MGRQESHRIHLQALQAGGSGSGGGGDDSSTASSWDEDGGASSSSASSFSSFALSLVNMGRGSSSTNTTTANGDGSNTWDEKIVTQSTVVRLSDVAKTSDVTRVLRKKFGLGMVEHPNTTVATATAASSGTGTRAVSRINQRLHQLRKSGGGDSEDRKTTAPADVLVLVGTLTSVPQGYIQFEHEEPPFGAAEAAATASATPATAPNEGSASQPKSNTSSTAAAASNEVLLNSSFDTTASNFQSEPLTVLEIRSDHPNEADVAASSSAAAGQAVSKAMEPPRFGEPVHLIRTLQPHERPLMVRDGLYQQLLRFQQESHDEMGTTAGPDAAAPVITWYFQPDPQTISVAAGQSQHQPMGCLILDGYSTAIEEDDDEQPAKEEQEESKEHVEDGMTLSWKDEILRRHRPCASKNKARDWQEKHKMALLSQYEAALDNHCVSGFLLHQSSRHVWKRVHCVLTQDSFWFVFRSKRPKKPKSTKRSNRLLGRHVVLSLQGEGASVTDASTRRGHIPFGFCLSDGSATATSHIFRATSAAARDRWVQCLESRLRHCRESHWMESAQLLIQEDTRRRTTHVSQRCSGLLLPPSREKTSVEKKREAGWTPPGPGAMNCFRFAEGVEEYKEACRHWECLSSRLDGSTMDDAVQQKLKQALLCHTWQVAHRAVRKCVAPADEKSIAAQQEALEDWIARHVDPQDAHAAAPEIEVLESTTQNPTATATTTISSTTSSSFPLEAPPADLLDELLQAVCHSSLDPKES